MSKATVRNVAEVPLRVVDDAAARCADCRDGVALQFERLRANHPDQTPTTGTRAISPPTLIRSRRRHDPGEVRSGISLAPTGNSRVGQSPKRDNYVNSSFTFCPPCGIEFQLRCGLFFVWFEKELPQGGQEVKEGKLRSDGSNPQVRHISLLSAWMKGHAS